jgi:uncharacterized membrane protein
VSYSDDLEQESGLSYQEKSILFALVTSVLVYAIFSVLVWQRYQAGGFSTTTSPILFSTHVDSAGNITGEGFLSGTVVDFDSATVFQFWGRAVLLLIVVQIVLAIIGHIVLAIIHTITAKKEDIPAFEDERDKLIDLKATRNTFIVFGIGFMLSMVVLAIGLIPALVPVIMLAFMMAAEIGGNISRLYLYRRGF